MKNSAGIPRQNFSNGILSKYRKIPGDSGKEGISKARRQFLRNVMSTTFNHYRQPDFLG